MALLKLGMLVTALAQGLLSSAQLTCPDRCSCTQDSATRLGVIDCSNLGLTEIPDIFHPAGGNLLRVDLSNNMLTELDVIQTYKLIQGSRVDHLDFSNNRINRVTGSFDVNLGRDYVRLDLSNNEFTVFPSAVIPITHGRAELILDFSNNRITELTANMFAGGDGNLFGFQFLASNNLITRIDSDAFQGVQLTDTILDLRGNQLRTLSEDFKLPTGIREFKFSDNPWECDCNLRWIIHPSRSIINATETDPPNCQSPSSLRGQPLFRLTANEFACLPFQNGPLMRDINDQDGYTLSCPASANPPNPVITWTVWLPCPDSGNPIRFFFESEELSLTNIEMNNPRAAFRCTATNNAGAVDFDLDVRYNGEPGIPIPEKSNNTAPTIDGTASSMTITPMTESGGNEEVDGSSGRPVAGIIILVILLVISWAVIAFLVYKIWDLKTNGHRRRSNEKSVDYQANGNGAVHTITGSAGQESYTEVRNGHSNGTNGYGSHPVQNGDMYATPHKNSPIKPATPYKPSPPLKPPTPKKPMNPYQYNSEYDEPPLKFGLRNDGYDYNQDSVI